MKKKKQPAEAGPNGVSLHIKWVKVENFRGIRELRLDFNTKSNIQVLVGVNGAGKSAVLECMAIMLSSFTERVKGDAHNARQFTDDDISCDEQWLQAHIGVCHQDSPLVWGIVKNRTGTSKSDLKSEPDRLNALTQSLTEQLAEKPINLPLAVYYNVRRALVTSPTRVHDSLEYKPIDAYCQALDKTTSEFDGFFQWFCRQEDLENEYRRDNAQYLDPLLETVRNAISEFMEDCNNLRIRRHPLRMTVSKEGCELNVQHLSDGEKSLLALVGDLARRLAIANPTLENRLDGGGVVLIDEVDLHLHPGWQRMVIEKLTTTFKNCQFILSTHSPQVVEHLEPENIWVLRREKKTTD